MADEIRFFTDQNIQTAVSDGLIRRGIDVLTAQSALRCGLPDLDQLSFAAAEGRVVVTFDPDFIALHQAGHSHAGIAWCPATKYSIGELLKMLILLHAVLTADEMKGNLEYL